MKINYAIICYKELDGDNIQVKHKCLYENKPEDVDIFSLQQELDTDEEFGMVGDDDYEMMLIDRDNELWETFGLPYEVNED